MADDEKCQIVVRSRFEVAIDISPIAAFKWNQEYGIKLRDMRDKAGLSRKQLSQQVGLSQTYIQQLESPQSFKNQPKKNPDSMTVSAEAINEICEALGGDVVSFFWDLVI